MSARLPWPLQLVIVALSTLACTAQGGPPSPLGGGPSRVSLVDEGEPGRPLVLAGHVYELDGTTPVAGGRLELYQTDAGGMYTRPVSVAREARIRGSVWTDDAGRYEVRTIMPGSYPGQDAAAHIHVHLAAPEVPDHWVPSFLFAGDPHLSPDDVESNAELGRFSAVVELEADEAGVLHGRRDFLLDLDRARRNRLVDGWYRGE